MQILPKTYDYKLFTLNTGTSDYDTKTNISELFNNLNIARKVIIFTDQNISFRFNNVNLPLVPLLSKHSPYQAPDNFLGITNIFLTNTSGVNAEVTIWLI